MPMRCPSSISRRSWRAPHERAPAASSSRGCATRVTARGSAISSGHGVPPELDAAVMAAAREFFALPEAERRALAIASSPHFRGYTVLGGERTKGVSDWREQLDVGPEEPARRRHARRSAVAAAARPEPVARAAARDAADGARVDARDGPRRARRAARARARARPAARITSTTSCCRAAIRT